MGQHRRGGDLGWHTERGKTGHQRGLGHADPSRHGNQTRQETRGGVQVLADAIDRLTGRDYRDVPEERVCTPLGLPRVLGLAPEMQDDVCELVPMSPEAETDEALRFNVSSVRAAGNPAGAPP